MSLDSIISDYKLSEKVNNTTVEIAELTNRQAILELKYAKMEYIIIHQNKYINDLKKQNKTQKDELDKLKTKFEQTDLSNLKLFISEKETTNSFNYEQTLKKLISNCEITKSTDDNFNAFHKIIKSITDDDNAEIIEDEEEDDEEEDDEEDEGNEDEEDEGNEGNEEEDDDEEEGNEEEDEEGEEDEGEEDEGEEDEEDKLFDGMFIIEHEDNEYFTNDKKNGMIYKIIYGGGRGEIKRMGEMVGRFRRGRVSLL